MEHLIEIENVSRTYCGTGQYVTALRNVTLKVGKGDFIALMGASGSGKTTLLNIMGLLDRPSSGRVIFGGSDVSAYSDESLSMIRATRIGFVFQSFNLIPHFDALENVELPFLYGHLDEHEGRRRALEALGKVGLAQRVTHRPGELSGGEAQRVAIARAIAPGPDIILADEPTGNLDTATGDSIMDILERLNAEGAAVILVTHDERRARRARKIVQITDGAFMGEQDGQYPV